ncbi:MAG: DoxX family protein [Bacteroidetes bacterium]|nr:DoxX family protein [Bacteroidota bacterium]MBS1939396.1 DoxX family protein [Bacteroidota bacterium]
MAPLIALASLFVACMVVGQLGFSFFADWTVCLRFALAGMFLLTASAHWGKRRAELVRMVPPVLGNAGIWVTLTGMLEIVGAVGLLVPATVHWAAIGLGLLLVALFPANVHAARSGGTLDGKPVMGVLPRGLLQVLFLACTMAVAVGA